MFGAQLAAPLGLPYAFASHFAPDDLLRRRSTVYREQLPARRSSSSGRTRWSGVNVVAAETDAEARRLFTSLQQAFTNLRSGRPGPHPPPIDDIDAYWTPAEKAAGDDMLRYAIVGSPETVRARARSASSTPPAPTS